MIYFICNYTNNTINNIHLYVVKGYSILIIYAYSVKIKPSPPTYNIYIWKPLNLVLNILKIVIGCRSPVAA